MALAGFDAFRLVDTETLGVCGGMPICANFLPCVNSYFDCVNHFFRALVACSL
jgi:hypothetical protein